MCGPTVATAQIKRRTKRCKTSITSSKLQQSKADDMLSSANSPQTHDALNDELLLLAEPFSQNIHGGRDRNAGHPRRRRRKRKKEGQRRQSRPSANEDQR